MKTPSFALVLTLTITTIGCAGRVSTSPNSAPTSGTSTTPTYVMPSVVFIGDSITHNWTEYSDWFTVYPTWNNQGVIGQSSLTILSRFNPDAVLLKPQIIHIIAGTNDVYPNWTPCSIDNAPQYSTCANIAQMSAEAASAGIKVIVGTIPPWNCAAVYCKLATDADDSASRYDRINQLNEFIKQFGATNNITVVDYHSALVSADGKTYVPAYTVDGVHPSSSGYNLMAPLAVDAIKRTVQQ